VEAAGGLTTLPVSLQSRAPVKPRARRATAANKPKPPDPTQSPGGECWACHFEPIVSAVVPGTPLESELGVPAPDSGSGWEPRRPRRARRSLITAVFRSDNVVFGGRSAEPIIAKNGACALAGGFSQKWSRSELGTLIFIGPARGAHRRRSEHPYLGP
jgi:hypothetical protein